MASKSRKKALWYLVLLLILASGALGFVYMRNQPAPAAQNSAPPPPPSGVSCLGRIQPEQGNVIVGARSLSGQPSVIAKLNVKEGDSIKAGQTIAVLDSLPQLEAAVRQAESRIKAAEVRVKQAGETTVKPGDIAVQKAGIARLEVDLANARSNLARTEDLFKNAATTKPVLDHDRYVVDAITKQIAEAKERLNTMGEIRQIDVDVAAAEVRAAEAELQRLKVESESAIIRAPYSGVVLKVYAFQGSEVTPRGILEIARVDQMSVVAEVAESDIQRVKLGQRAKITGYVLPHPIEGAVERLGLKVSRNSLAVDDAVNITDARVVEVRIRLDDSADVRNLIDAQVEVLINTK